MRRILKWTALIGGGCLALLLVVGAIWEQAARRQTAAAYPAAGRLVDVGGRRMQIDCRGSGSPTVIFETGLDYFGSLAWAKVHDPVAQFTRACAYSRAGIVWSEAKRGPHDGLGAAHDLHSTLAAAGETAPFVMVGLSLGGPIISIYTGLYAAQVAGLVYVDAAHPDQLRRFQAVLGNSPSDKAFIQGIGGKLSWTGVPRLVALSARNSRGETLAAMPQRSREIALAYFATSLESMVAERDATATTFDEAAAYRDLGTRPVVVLTHGKPLSDVPKTDSGRWERTWLEMQEEMATWSSHGVQRTIRDAGHYIANDDPDAVIAAIREVVDDVRSATARSERQDPDPGKSH